MLDMMGTLLDRPVIHHFFQHNYFVLVEMCSNELDDAKVLFDKQLARAKTPLGPILNKNMPPMAGKLRWCQQLRDRICSFMERLKLISNGLDTEKPLQWCIVLWLSIYSITKSTEAMVVFGKYDQMIKLIEE